MKLPALPQTEYRRAVNRLALSVLILLMLWLLSMRLAAWALRDYRSPELNLLLNDVCLYLVAAPIYLLFLRSVPSVPGPKTRLPVSQWAVYLLIGVFLTYSAGVVTNLLMAAASAVLRLPLPNRLEEVLASVPLWQIFLYTVVLAPFGEEFLFRRCLCDRLRPFGEWPAAVLSALAFAAFHTNLYQFAYAFLLGLLMAHLYLRTGRWLYTVALHAAINFLFGFLSTAVQRVVGVTDGSLGSSLPEQLSRLSVAMTYLSLCLSLVGVGLAFLIAFRRRIRFASSPALSRGEALRLAFLTPGVLLLTVVTVAVTLFLR